MIDRFKRMLRIEPRPPMASPEPTYAAIVLLRQATLEVRRNAEKARLALQQEIQEDDADQS